MFPLNHHLRVYCERTNDALFAEPINIASSLGFFLAAFLLWRLCRRHRAELGPAPDIAVLILITVMIGAGSIIFHSVATVGSMLFDIVPIALFVIFYLVAFARSLLDFSRVATALLLLALIAVNALYKQYVFRAVDGYFSYLPTFLFLLALTLYMLLKNHPSALRMAGANLVAFASLFFRTVDRHWCNEMPVGTHFLWHMGNALLVYILVRELVVYRLSHGNR